MGTLTVNMAEDLASKVTLKFVFSPANYKGDVENLSLHLTFSGIDGETKTVQTLTATTRIEH